MTWEAYFDAVAPEQSWRALMWYYADWVCEGCKGPQLGAKPWGDGRLRCVACGPGAGLAPCPADHTNKKACPLCKGAGYVEAL
jgi:hypothetical protein